MIELKNFNKGKYLKSTKYKLLMENISNIEMILCPEETIHLQNILCELTDQHKFSKYTIREYTSLKWMEGDCKGCFILTDNRTVSKSKENLTHDQFVQKYLKSGRSKKVRVDSRPKKEY